MSRIVAPRSGSAETHARPAVVSRRSARRDLALLAAAAAAVSALTTPARICAQEPRPPQPDTVQLPPGGPDSAQVAADTLGPVPELPRFPDAGAVGWSTGV